MVKNVFKKLGKKQKNNKGFSLVELIVVIAIMAVLVGVLAPQLMKYVEKSREATDIQNCDSIASALKAYYADKEDQTADVTINVTKNGVTETTDPAVKDAGMVKTKLKGKNWTKIAITYKPADGSIEYTITEDATNKPYYKIEDSQGNVLIETDAESTKEQALTESTGWLMNKILQTVMTSGTGRYYKISGVECFGKTGTTTDSKDRWFVGGTPEYVAAVWYGYDMPKEIVYRLSYNPAGTIWETVMNGIYETKGKNVTEFPEYDGIVQRSYDSSTGLLTNYSSGNYGWYDVNNLPGYSSRSRSSSRSSSSSSSGSSSDNSENTTESGNDSQASEE